MVPSKTLCSTTYCLVDPGNEYLVFQSDSGSFTIQIEAGEYEFEWFNPNLGTVQESGALTASKQTRSFAPPFSGEAVLYLKRMQAVSTPKISPDGGEFVGSISVTLSSDTDSTEIRYTTNGDTPTESSSLYTEPFTLTDDAVVKAIAYDGVNSSDIASASFSFSGGQVHAIPGIIQAEDYKPGGEGIGYHDTTPGNTFGKYRNDDVDIEL